MSLARVAILPVIATMISMGVKIRWAPFHSTIYPYTISQPSSFTHGILPTPSGQQGDFFFPALGSFTTGLNIVAEPLKTDPPPADAVYLRSTGGKQVQAASFVTIMKHRSLMYRANYAGLAGHWTEERLSFAANGYYWHITVSYAYKYRSMRSLMIRMVQSFHTGGSLSKIKSNL